MLTLADAIRLALEHNPETIAAREGIDEAQLALRLAESAFAPKLTPSAFGSFGQSSLANQSYGLAFSQRLLTGTELRATLNTGSSRNQLGTYFLSNTSLVVTQPLLRGFDLAAQRQGLSRAEARMADAGRRRSLVEQQVALQIASAYYAVIRQRTLISLAGKSLERARQLADASEAKLNAGKVSQLDMLRAKQLVTQAEAYLLDSEASAADALDELCVLMGLPESKSFVMEPAIALPPVPVAAGDVDATAAGRWEVQMAADAVQEATRALSAARVQLRPQFDVSLAVTRQGIGDSARASFGTDDFQPVALGTISVPLDRTPQQVDVQTAAIEVARRRRELESIRMRVIQNIRQATRHHERTMKALDLAEADSDFARQETDVARIRFERGLSNNLELVSAETGLLTAESRRVTALADLAIARLSLSAALGVLDPRAIR